MLMHRFDAFITEVFMATAVKMEFSSEDLERIGKALDMRIKSVQRALNASVSGSAMYKAYLEEVNAISALQTKVFTLKGGVL